MTLKIVTNLKSKWGGGKIHDKIYGHKNKNSNNNNNNNNNNSQQEQKNLNKFENFLPANSVDLYHNNQDGKKCKTIENENKQSNVIVEEEPVIETIEHDITNISLNKNFKQATKKKSGLNSFESLVPSNSIDLVHMQHTDVVDKEEYKNDEDSEEVLECVFLGGNSMELFGGGSKNKDQVPKAKVKNNDKLDIVHDETVGDEDGKIEEVQKLSSNGLSCNSMELYHFNKKSKENNKTETILESGLSSDSMELYHQQHKKDNVEVAEVQMAKLKISKNEEGTKLRKMNQSDYIDHTRKIAKYTTGTATSINIGAGSLSCKSTSSMPSMAQLKSKFGKTKKSEDNNNNNSAESKCNNSQLTNPNQKTLKPVVSILKEKSVYDADFERDPDFVKRPIQFEDMAFITWAHTKEDYLRKGSIRPSIGSPELLRQEIDDYKENEMTIHPQSVHRTLIYRINRDKRRHYETKRQNFFKRQEVENAMYRRRLMEYVKDLFAGKVQNPDLYSHLISVEQYGEVVNLNKFPIEYSTVLGPEVYLMVMQSNSVLGYSDSCDHYHGVEVNNNNNNNNTSNSYDSSSFSNNNNNMMSNNNNVNNNNNDNINNYNGNYLITNQKKNAGLHSLSETDFLTINCIS